MQQHIRNLIIQLRLKPGDENKIAGTSAIMGGIASQIDLVSGTLTNPDNAPVAPIFSIGEEPAMTRASTQPVLYASLRLFGIIPAEKQELSIAIALTNGTVQTIKTDLTDYLKNFGNGEEPLILNAILSLPPEVGVTATITDWVIVKNGNININ